jgi:hypothetical protein
MARHSGYAESVGNAGVVGNVGNADNGSNAGNVSNPFLQPFTEPDRHTKPNDFTA